MAVVSRLLTLEEFAALPEEEPLLEFADGVVTQKVSPKGKHSALRLELLKQLDRAGMAGEAARAFPELPTAFAGASYVPDIAVYRCDRIPWDDAGEIANDFRTAPDAAVEIVSPEQSVTALVRRCLWYVAHGVEVALLIDPADKSVLAFHPDGRVSALHSTDRIDLGEVLPDFDLTVEQLLASLRREP